MDIRTANPKTKEADKLVIGFTGLPQECKTMHDT